MNLGSYLTRASQYWPSLEAVVCGSNRLTYRELELTTNRLASGLLGAGLEPGDAVATYAANCAELVATEFALYKAGLLRVPVNSRLSAEETGHILADARVRIVLVDELHAQTVLTEIRRRELDCQVVGYDVAGPGIVPMADLLAKGTDTAVAIEVTAEDPAVLNFTSGSTGTLKAAVQTTGNRLANMRKRLMSPEGLPGPGERYLVAGPITHASGMGMLASLSRGSTVVVMPRWDAGDFLRLVAQEQITSTFLVPTMLNMVLSHSDLSGSDLSSLQCIRVGGSPVSPQRLREAVSAFGPIVMQGYGQAETTSGVTVLTCQDVHRGVESDPQLLASCGRALFDTEVRVVDADGNQVAPCQIGEVIVRGPDCVREYWHEPELSKQTFRAGWVHTGDVGYLRDDGYLFIVDRLKDMIISGGFNVYSSEVEAALYEHPDVAEVCVIGVPDEQWGEAVKAVVVIRSDRQPSEQELIDFCADRLSRMKQPQSIDFVTDLPVNRNGKIDRRAVRSTYWSDEHRRVH